ncbi:MAG: DinB family protein [Nocardioidaceae bacterium]
MTGFPEPAADTADPAELFRRYLRYYRETVVRKLEALPEEVLRTSQVGSGWTPLELANHLAFMERRWFVWGYLGEDVDTPWGDSVEHRWYVPDDRSLEDVVAMLDAVGERTDAILAEHPIDALGNVGGRFGEEPPTLAWICFHVLQEYARHAGHLDISVELAGGPLGE